MARNAQGTASEGLLPGYETVVITKPEMSTQAFTTMKERISSIIKNFGGEEVLQEDWGKRKLSYNIHKESRGKYNYIAYTGKPGVVGEIERNLRLNENVIRFLSVCLEDEFDKDEFLKSHALLVKSREERNPRDEFRERGGRDDYRGSRSDREGYGHE